MNDKMRKRQALSASISADALLANEQQSHVVKRQFAITDILNPKKGDTLPRAPVYRPRQGKNVVFQNYSEEQNSPSFKSFKTELRSPLRPLENYAERLEQPENTALFTYASALCHRVTGRYLPRTLLLNDPEAQQRELERAQRDPEILRAIDCVRVLSAQFKDVAQNTMGHRKDLGLSLFRIEESYLKLFEKLLELSLRLYWDYEQRTEAERREDRATAERWREKYEHKCDECVRVNKRLAAREIVHRTREIELKDYQAQLREIEKEVRNQHELEAQILQLQDAAALQRVLDRKLQDDFTLLSTTHEEMLVYQKQLREESLAQHKQIIDDLRRTVREKDRFITKQEVTLHHLEEKASVIYEPGSSQTEIDDDGLWDVQDGIPRFVSKNVAHKMMWRRFSAFVCCKNCGGRPLPKAAKTNPFGSNSHDEDSEETDIWSVDRRKEHTKKAAKRLELTEQKWELPGHIVLFLSNLPKSVVAFPFYTLEQVSETIEAIYEDKFASDKADEADGVARDELSRFICEYFLKTHGLRQSAEIGLYRFLISVKNTFHQNSHVRLFARLANLLKIEDEDAEVSGSTSILTTASTRTGKKKHIIISSQTSDSSSDFHVKTKERSSYLDRSFLRVFLEARHYLLRAPPRVLPRTTKKQRQSAPGSPNHTLLEKDHVVQVEMTRKWVPLDHAITVLRWYINCLPEDIVSIYCRQIEHSTAIYDGKTIAEIAGNRLAVRAAMRRVMLVNESADSSSTCQDTNIEGNTSRHRPLSPRVVADVHKVLKLLMDALEQLREGIKKDLTALFDAGDMNHDCVLNLDEFSAIIRRRKPHFSDRRILRMFREALMGGVDQSFALSMEAFTVVCNDHGLVSLLPDDRMIDPFTLSDPRRSISRQREELLSRDLKFNEELAQATNAVDLSSSLLVEIPEDINWEESTLLSARAEEIEEENIGTDSEM